jgi:peptidyl-prolyl cis-trans isomerase SurA
MIPELEAVAFNLPQDKISGLIESGLGFHIIKVVDKRGAGLKPIDAVREEIKAKLEDGKLEKKYDEWISGVRKKSHIEIR